MQVLPGVYQINGSPFGRHQNSYLVRAEGATVLVDSGDMQESSFEDVRSAIVRWGLPPEDISHLFVTHEHVDHASHAARWQRQGVKVIASRPAAEAMSVGDDRCIGYAVQREFEPCRPDVTLNDGDCVRVGELEVRAFAAPGHCAGLMVFEVVLGGERVWFTSDLFEAVHAHRLVNLPYTGAPDFDRSTFIASLRRLRSLPRADHVLPGHGPVALGRGARLLDMAYDEAMMSWR